MKDLIFGKSVSVKNAISLDIVYNKNKPNFHAGQEVSFNPNRNCFIKGVETRNGTEIIKIVQETKINGEILYCWFATKRELISEWIPKSKTMNSIPQGNKELNDRLKNLK